MSGNYNHFDSIADGLHEMLGEVVETACAHIEAGTKSRLHPGYGWDTGLLHSSYTHETDRSNLTGEIGTVVAYAPYVELGTHRADGRVRMPAKPHLVPAVEAERDAFNQAVSSVWGKKL